MDARKNNPVAVVGRQQADGGFPPAVSEDGSGGGGRNDLRHK
jgi:hypothetical protein